MAKRERSHEPREYIEVQKGPIRMDEQYSKQLPREPERTMRDLENNFMRQEKMTLTMHTPKR